MDEKVSVDYTGSFFCTSDWTIDLFSAKRNMVSTKTFTVCTSDSLVIIECMYVATCTYKLHTYLASYK